MAADTNTHITSPSHLLSLMYSKPDISGVNKNPRLKNRAENNCSAADVCNNCADDNLLDSVVHHLLSV